MKYGKILTALALALAMCLGLTACGGNNNSDNNDNNDPIQTAPPVIEGAVYDSAADASAYDEYYGGWEGASDAKCDTLVVSATDGGMYFTFYKAGEIAASGCAQVIEEYGKLYFFNEHDGCAYLAQGSANELAIESFGTYAMSGSGSTEGADEAFADIAGVWYLDGEKDGLSCIVILSDGQWGLGERTEAGEDFTTVDRGQLERDSGDADQYYAHSSDFEGVTYDMHTTAEKDTFWWGGENDTYLRQASSR